MEDSYVKLARTVLEQYVRRGGGAGEFTPEEDRFVAEVLSRPAEATEELFENSGGVFVCIKNGGQLRGCIGTIEAVRPNLAEEIAYNAISSGTRDPRFYPVRQDELPSLTYQVDVLMPARPVTQIAELDAKRYGVIVSKGRRRGLLLPDLEGVDTVEQQLAIACQKAGISSEEDYQISCFEVVRHE